MDALAKAAKEHAGILEPQVPELIISRLAQCEDELFSVAAKFVPQIERLAVPDSLPAENNPLQERVMSAAAWFSEYIDKQLRCFLEELVVESDNQAVRQQFADLTEKAQKEVFVRQAVLQSCMRGFDPATYLRTRSAADVDFRPAVHRKPAGQKQLEPGLHPALHAAIRSWRNNLASEHGVPVYMVLPQKTMTGLLEQLPLTTAALKLVKGIGPARIKQYGAELVTIIRDYCEEQGIMPDQQELLIKPKRK